MGVYSVLVSTLNAIVDFWVVGVLPVPQSVVREGREFLIDHMLRLLSVVACRPRTHHLLARGSSCRPLRCCELERHGCEDKLYQRRPDR